MPNAFCWQQSCTQKCTAQKHEGIWGHAARRRPGPASPPAGTSVHVAFLPSVWQTHGHPTFHPAGCLLPAAWTYTAELHHRCLSSIYISFSVAFASLMLVLAVVKKICFIAFVRNPKTLAFICNVLYPGPRCLRVLYRLCHAHLWPRSRCLSLKR